MQRVYVYGAETAYLYVLVFRFARYISQYIVNLFVAVGMFAVGRGQNTRQFYIARIYIGKTRYRDVGISRRTRGVAQYIVKFRVCRRVFQHACKVYIVGVKPRKTAYRYVGVLFGVGCARNTRRVPQYIVKLLVAVGVFAVGRFQNTRKVYIVGVKPRKTAYRYVSVLFGVGITRNARSIAQYAVKLLVAVGVFAVRRFQNTRKVNIVGIYPRKAAYRYVGVLFGVCIARNARGVPQYAVKFRVGSVVFQNDVQFYVIHIEPVGKIAYRYVRVPRNARSRF